MSTPAERNKGPILDVLRRGLGPGGLLLEIAGGPGVHALHFARGLPGWTVQSSDADAGAVARAEARRAEAAQPNLLPPVRLDVAQHPWPVERADAVICINMVHITPQDTTLALLDGAGRILPEGGLLFLYGPYHVDGGPTSEGNRDFDAWLREQDPRWGIRDRDAVTGWAAERGFRLVQVEAMPANNQTLIFRKSAG